MTTVIPATELAGKVAIVTGAAMGIGRAIAVELGEAGASVVVADIRGAEEAAVSLKAEGINAIGVTVDVSDEDTVAAMAARTVEELGGIDILVNNAGLFTTLRSGPLEAIAVAEWRRVMDVNVLGSFLAIRAVVPAMRARGGGKIVNIASGTPFKGVANLLHYVTSKGAVIAMTRSVARELGGEGIRANAVAPGFTVSDGILAQDDVTEMRTSAAGKRVLQREQLPADIVGAVRFLAGPASDFITGQTIVVDGGAHFH